MPLARHSSLPELIDLVALFKPHNIYPNTTFPELRGHDYLLLSQYFAHTLAPGGKERLRRDAREFQQTISASEGKQPVRQARLPSPQEEEQSQEVQEELMSKFAHVPNNFSEAYVTSNFDHLDNPNDLELLVECFDEESDLEHVEKVASQELEEILPSKRVANNVPLPGSQQSKAGEATPPIPSSSNDGTEAGPSTRAPLRQASAPSLHKNCIEGTPWALGKLFCLDPSIEVAERHMLQEAIYKRGGAVTSFGQADSSIDTAISHSDVVICQFRTDRLYKVVSHQLDHSDSELTPSNVPSRTFCSTGTRETEGSGQHRMAQKMH